MSPASTRKQAWNSRKGVPPQAEDDAVKSLHLLVVDDDPEIRQALDMYFQLGGWRVTTVEDGAEALDVLGQDPGFDLVLLDVVLPKINGFEVLRRSQEMGTASPVLMMSGRGDQENILKGFGLGAQDYIVKPFDAEELVARTTVLLGKRPSSTEPLTLCEIGDLTVDFTSERASRNDDVVSFPEMEMDLLRCLVRNRGYVVTKKRLLREAWRIDENRIAHTINPDIAIARIDESIASIKSKVEPDPSNPRYIETVYGLGYRFNY